MTEWPHVLYDTTTRNGLNVNHNKKNVKVTQDLLGCPPLSSRKKIRMHAILKENTANYISLERLINVDFRKNI